MKYPGKILFAITASSLSIAATASAASADEAGGMPSLVIPPAQAEDAKTDRDPSAEDMAARSLLFETIREEALSKYINTDDGADPDRIAALVSGDYLADYIGTGGDPVRFSNGEFREDTAPPAPKPEVAEKESLAPSDAGGMKDFLMSAAGIRAMSNMSRDQIEAIALMVEIMENPDAPVAGARSGPGVPGLSREDLSELDPGELQDMIAGKDRERVVDVGDGRNMVLANWYAGKTDDGVVFIENDRMPGSRVDVRKGMIFGEFGSVADVSTDEGEVVVTFSTGDSLSSRPDAPRVAGVPKVEEEDASRDGEILISIPPPDDVSEQDEGRDAPDADDVKASQAAGSAGPDGKTRPKVRPVDVEENPGPDVVRPKIRPSGLREAGAGKAGRSSRAAITPVNEMAPGKIKDDLLRGRG